MLGVCFVMYQMHTLNIFIFDCFITKSGPGVLAVKTWSAVYLLIPFIHVLYFYCSMLPTVNVQVYTFNRWGWFLCPTKVFR